MYKRNFEDPNEYDFKSTGAKNLDSYHKSYHKLNKQYKLKLYNLII